MMTARFFLGVSLFGLLIVDISSHPVKGFTPTSSYSSGNTNAATNFASNQGAPSSNFSPGRLPSNAPSSDFPMPVPEPSFSQSSGQREPAASTGSSSSRPVQSGYSASSSQQGIAAQPDNAVKWAVAPPSIFSSDQDAPAVAAQAAGSSGSDASQFLPPPPPPGPVYQPGELSHFEKNAEAGSYQSETEELGYPDLPVERGPFGPAFAGQPPSGVGGLWGYPYPYFDYRFLTGQYPPGTVSHFSHNYEQGRDFWQDTHYVKEHGPVDAGADQQVQTSTGNFATPQDSRQLVAVTRQSGVQAGQPGSSSRGFAQPVRY